MSPLDPFRFFRLALEIFVSIYAIVVTLQSVHGWLLQLAGSARHMSLIRRYVVLHTLRVRAGKFAHDIAVCLLLCVALLLIWRAHHVLHLIDVTLHTDAGRTVQTR